ncbi:para-aminobenzoate synthase, subunit I [Solidesulfovibrio fructosivorans JJ]]|uniref:Para-aminobenzoate synthase, subunit I n=1 Tax=Solidesulfovibrio fructosivorans JJ] TaxID=596151 RepID=E1K1D2_SOLFR|nr:chorismate-binding protein [Solidesulfovibrio fructosivorans]EFL49618.1 para-aminobenzoate synthase, subunit I [Solidesulfovibrio fructosivorans JJ]]
MFGEALFSSYAAGDAGWTRYFHDPAWTATAWELSEVMPLLEAAEAWRRQGHWLVLALAYEAAPAFDPRLETHAPGETPLAFAAAYPAPSEPPARAAASGDFFVAPWRPLVSRRRYDAALGVIRDNIRRGEVYQVNYTLQLASRLQGDPSGWFEGLARQQAAGFCCRLDLGRHKVLSFSPELFFRRAGELVVARPMKGTMPRGRTLEEDVARAKALAACPKNRAENRMITDLLRNDLGRLARSGSVAVPACFEVSRLSTAWQMTSTVTARVPRELGLTAIFSAIFPCGSITGAPKRSAMRLIRELEGGPRGFYTGAFGHVAPDGDCVFSVPIRTVVCDADTGECRFGVGGGVTYYSDARDEYEECRIKAAFLHTPPEPFDLLETLLLTEGRFAFLPEHLARLARSAAYYGFRHDAAAVSAALEAVAAACPGRRLRVRLLLSRDGAVRTEHFPLGKRRAGPVRLGWADTPVEASDAALFHKTTRRARYDRALAARPDCDDVLLFNKAGQVTESCRANLVAAIDGRLLTPALDCGLLAGTLRQRLLARGVLAEAALTPADLARAGRLWLVNSVRLWTPAVLVGEAPAGGPSTGSCGSASS